MRMRKNVAVIAVKNSSRRVSRVRGCEGPVNGFGPSGPSPNTLRMKIARGKLSPNAILSKINRTATVGAKKVTAGTIAFLITLCTKVARGVTLDGRKM